MFSSQRKGVTEPPGWPEQLTFGQPIEALQKFINPPDPPRYWRPYLAQARSNRQASLA